MALLLSIMGGLLGAAFVVWFVSFLHDLQSQITNLRQSINNSETYRWRDREKLDALKKELETLRWKVK